MFRYYNTETYIIMYVLKVSGVYAISSWVAYYSVQMKCDIFYISDPNKQILSGVSSWYKLTNTSGVNSFFEVPNKFFFSSFSLLIIYLVILGWYTYCLTVAVNVPYYRFMCTNSIWVRIDTKKILKHLFL